MYLLVFVVSERRRGRSGQERQTIEKVSIMSYFFTQYHLFKKIISPPKKFSSGKKSYETKTIPAKLNLTFDELDWKLRDLLAGSDFYRWLYFLYRVFQNYCPICSPFGIDYSSSNNCGTPFTYFLYGYIKFIKWSLFWSTELRGKVS